MLQVMGSPRVREGAEQDPWEHNEVVLCDTACDIQCLLPAPPHPQARRREEEKVAWRGQWSPCLGRVQKWEHLGVTRSRHQQEPELCLLLSSSCPPSPGPSLGTSLTLREG